MGARDIRGAGPRDRAMKVLAVACAAAAMAATLAAAPGTAGEAASSIAVVASGLNNPRGLDVAPDGTVYVAEAGTGGPCRTVSGTQACSAFTASITRIRGGKQTRFAKGFLSTGTRGGSYTVGVDDVAVAPGGGVYALEGGGRLQDPAPYYGTAGARQYGTLFRVSSSGRKRAVLDCRTYEWAHNPQGSADGSNPYGLALVNGTPLVADAAGNTLYAVKGGSLELLAVFPQQVVAGKSADSVPTSVTVGPDGAYYVGELGGYGLPVGKARVWRVVPGQQPTVFATGFNTITGIAFGPDKSLYVGELYRNGFAKGGAGAVIRVAPNGKRTELARGELEQVGGVAVSRTGAVYVSVESLRTGSGKVVRIQT